MKFALALLVSYAAAAKKNLVDGGIKTTYDYSITTQEQADAHLDSWYASVAKPFLNEYREQVYAAALAEAEAERGVLLATCDAGT